MSVGRNLLASAFGNAWTALVQVALVPVYIQLLGVEAYGLIGVYVFVQASFAILDLGLTPTLSREAARFSAGQTPAEAIRDLLRTIECVFLATAIVAALLMLALAPWIASHWLNAERIAPQTVVHSLGLIGVLVGLRWMCGLYRAAIGGFERLVWLNAVTAAFATLRAAGVILFLAWVSRSIEAFFAYQCALTLVELAVVSRKAWRLMPPERRPAFSVDSLRAVARFSGGLAVVAALYLVLTQIDKVLLSGMVPLTSFAYYTLAASVAGALNLLVAPIGQVAYPRLNRLAAGGSRDELMATFHGFAQLMSVVIAPPTAVLALFSSQLLTLWTGDSGLSAAAAPLLVLLSLGTLLNGYMSTPYMVAIAHGRTWKIAMVNAILVLAFVPAIYLGISAYGVIAAAAAWAAINAAGLLLALPLLHVDLPSTEKWRWLAFDVALPTFAALAAAATVRLATRNHDATPIQLLGMAGAYFAALLAACAASPSLRRRLVMRRTAARTT
jgi:O-antigen/teichoic acid export membrane protein